MYKVFIDTIERNPTNLGSLSINFEKEEENGALFFRKALSDSLIFKGVDYEYFAGITDICQEIDIDIQQDCGSGYVSVFVGVTAITKCSFNPNRCTVTVEVAVQDDYTCILDNIDKEVNILEEPNRQDGVQVNSFQSFQFRLFDTGALIPPTSSWSFTGASFTSATGEGFFVWGRKITTTNCVAGVPQAPPDDGSGLVWTLLIDACGATGTSTYFRQLTAAEKTNISSNLAYTEDVVPNCPPAAAAPALSTLIATLTQVTSCVSAYLLNSAATTVNIQNGRLLTDVIDFILSENGCTQTLLSDFFTNVTNPVTGLNPSTTNELILYEKSDIVRPTASEKASKSIATFGQLMNDLSTLFNVRWNVSGTDLIIEHISDLAQSVGLDLTTYQGGKWIKNKSQFDYLDAEIPLEEKYKFPVDTIGIDFAGYPIEYSSTCSTLNESIYQTQLIETEFSRIYDNSNEGLDGLVLVAPFTLNATGVFSSKAENGRITNIFQPNAPLGYGALLPDYHTWDRPLPNGDINNIATVMDSTKPLKQQQELIVPFCCVNDFNPIELVRTNLGDGQVLEASYNLKTKSLNLTLGFEL